MRVPDSIPQVGLQSPQSGGYQAPRVVPYEFQSLDTMAATAATNQRYSQQVAQNARITQDRIKDSRVKSTDALFTEKITGNLSGFLKKIGQAAIDDRDAVLDFARTQHATLRKGLADDDERAAFDEQTRKSLFLHELAINDHYDEQSKALAFGASDARRLSASAAGKEAFMGGQLDAYNDAKETVRVEAEAMREMVGAEKHATYVRDALSEMHTGIVEKLVDAGRVGDASSYLERAKKAGEMDPKQADKVQTKIERGKIDTDAWSVANEVFESGLPIDGQRMEIDRRVRSGLVTPEAAMKALSLVQSFDDQKWQGNQREIASTKRDLEQMFAKDENLGVDGLTAEWGERIDRLGLRSEASKIHNDVRLNRVADMVGEGSVDSLVMQRHIRALGDLDRLSEILEKRKGNIQGDELKSPQGKEKVKRIEKQIHWIGQTQDAIADGLVIRSFVTSDDNLGRTTGTAPNTAPPPPTDMKTLVEELKKALYPGSGR